jgi:hypothetical protein
MDSKVTKKKEKILLKSKGSSDIFEILNKKIVD